MVESTGTPFSLARCTLGPYSYGVPPLAHNVCASCMLPEHNVHIMYACVFFCFASLPGKWLSFPAATQHLHIFLRSRARNVVVRGRSRQVCTVASNEVIPVKAGLGRHHISIVEQSTFIQRLGIIYTSRLSSTKAHKYHPSSCFIKRGATVMLPIWTFVARSF